MSTNSEASNLHQQAAADHEAAAGHHRQAATNHDKDELVQAKAKSKSAMDSCNAAQKKSAAACAHTDK
jgi:hypothetical protein